MYLSDHSDGLGGEGDGRKDEDELGRLTATIVAGQAPAQIVDAMKEFERLPRDIDTELTSLEGLTPAYRAQQAAQ